MIIPKIKGNYKIMVATIISNRNQPMQRITNKNTIYSSFKNIIWEGLMNSFKMTSSYTINNNQILFCLIISQYSYNLLIIIDRVILMKSWKNIIHNMGFPWFLPRIMEWWLECRPLSNLGCSWKASPS